MKSKSVAGVWGVITAFSGMFIIAASSFVNQIRAAKFSEKFYVYDVLSTLGVILIAIGCSLYFKNFSK